MIFRDFVEQTRDAVESVAFGLRGERDITPMLHLDSRLGISVHPVDPMFFASVSLMHVLVERYAIPLIVSDRASKIAWTYCAWRSPGGGERPSEHPERREVLLATFIDPEVAEHWEAPIVRTGGPVVIGAWRSQPLPDGGPSITAIQEALR